MRQNEKMKLIRCAREHQVVRSLTLYQTAMKDKGNASRLNVFFKKFH